MEARHELGNLNITLRVKAGSAPVNQPVLLTQKTTQLTKEVQSCQKTHSQQGTVYAEKSSTA